MHDFAMSRGARLIDIIENFFSTLPHELLDGRAYPYMLPSIARDFQERNWAIRKVVRFYPRLIAHFDEYSGGKYHTILADYEDHFTDQFHRLKRFALEDAKHAGVLGDI